MIVEWAYYGLALGCLGPAALFAWGFNPIWVRIGISSFFLSCGVFFLTRGLLLGGHMSVAELGEAPMVALAFGALAGVTLGNIGFLLSIRARRRERTLAGRLADALRG